MPDPNVPDIGPSPSPDPSRAAGGLRVTVDLNLCQAYAQCCYAAPESFELRGHEILFYDPAPARARRGEIERAVQACPVRAISLQADRGDTP